MDQEFWNKRYQQEKSLYGKEPNSFFAQQLQKLRIGRILLPGEGEGRNAVFAARLGWTVSAFDGSEVAREHALTWAEQNHEHIHYHLSSAEDFPFPLGYFDAAALIFFHLPAGLRKNVHEKIEQSLKPGGKLILIGFGKQQLRYQSGGPKDQKMLFALEAVKKDFKHIVWLEENDGIEELQEGKVHQGQGHVISLLGEKRHILFN